MNSSIINNVWNWVKIIVIAGLLLFAVLFLAQNARAHGRFILPTHTVLSGEKAQTVGLIASISNDIFHPDRALGDNGKGVVEPDLKNLFSILREQVILPDGSVSDEISWQAFSRFSVADLPVEKSGTYRVSLVQPEVHMTTFKKPDGTPWRTFGKMQDIPEGATDIVRRTTASRVDTFITYNNTTRKAVEPTGVGLELAGETHPNDAFAGEPVKFRLFFNGKPVGQGVTGHFIRQSTRHRNQRGEIEVETDKDGRFTVTFDEAGFYLLEAEYGFPGEKDTDVDMHHHGLYLTLEVFPE